MEQPQARLAAELCGSFGMAVSSLERPYGVKLGILIRDSQTAPFWLRHPRPAARGEDVMACRMEPMEFPRGHRRAPSLLHMASGRA
ncbi:hypothetical protein [Chromobacterium haemolyticum]|uniref:hypothetical protein n=1 Tax=Chromobacterium haemolyticum TaxID=394935 RepID=UPI0013B40E1D|nr:hypothetical protein [Chromobacterium haemolyticum]